MTRPITLAEANAIIDTTLAKAAEMRLKPLTVAVLDAGGHLKALARQDGTSTLRPEVAQGKARGAVSLGMGSRAIFRRAQEQPFFVQAINGLAGGSLVPAAVLPTTIRRDYVANANDSYWLPNARHPLPPTARKIGR